MVKDADTVNGIIETTSEYGIKVNGVWYNPHGKAKEYMKDAVKGAQVSLTLTGHANDFRFIKVLDVASSGQGPGPIIRQPEPSGVAPAGTSTGYWESKNARDIENSVRISRHGAINTAVQILGVLNPKAPMVDIEQYVLKSIIIADMVLQYTNNDKNLQTQLIDKITGTPQEEDVA